MLAGVLLAVAVAWLRPFRIEIQGDSMRPTLEPGDWALAVRSRRPRTRDVVVLDRPDRRGFELVKRLVEPVDGGGWFVRGDNPAASTDSRTFGAVPDDAITGRVVLVYWPPRRWRLL